MDEFEWTPSASDAAQMIAEGNLSFEAVARAAGTTSPTLRKWREHPDFQAKVEAIRQDFRDHVRRRGIAILENRVAALNKRHDLMMQVIQARAADPRMKDVPGGDTGLLVVTGYRWPPKPKDGPKPLDDQDEEPDGPAVALVEVDTSLLKELREHEKQAAQELGQWAEKREVSGLNSGPISVIIGFDERLVKVYGDGSDPVGTA